MIIIIVNFKFIYRYSVRRYNTIHYYYVRRQRTERNNNKIIYAIENDDDDNWCRVLTSESFETR